MKFGESVSDMPVKSSIVIDNITTAGQRKVRKRPNCSRRRLVIVSHVPIKVPPTSLAGTRNIFMATVIRVAIISYTVTPKLVLLWEVGEIKHATANATPSVEMAWTVEGTPIGGKTIIVFSHSGDPINYF